MARSKSPLASIIIVALVLGLLFALNPSMDDFKAWRSAQAKQQAGGSNDTALGILKKGAGAIGSAMTGLASNLFFQRKDYLFFSTYAAGTKGDLYLGAARLFVKLR